MSLFDIFATLLFLYMVFLLLRWVFVTTLMLGAFLLSRIDPRQQARTRRAMQRIVRRARSRNEAITNVMTEEARAINDIFRR